eukprot:365342-Chlamydomonas_euryale.AAC.3
MPAGNVLLPSHGVGTPVCRSPRQHVGRHPGEDMLPAAQGLNKDVAAAGRQSTGQLHPRAKCSCGRGRPPRPSADRRTLPGTGAWRPHAPPLLLPDRTLRAAGVLGCHTWLRRRRRPPPPKSGWGSPPSANGIPRVTTWSHIRTPAMAEVAMSGTAGFALPRRRILDFSGWILCPLASP